MSNSKAASRAQVTIGIIFLLLLQFYVRPRLWDSRFAPDFVMVGLVLIALRGGPGVGQGRPDRQRTMTPARPPGDGDAGAAASGRPVLPDGGPGPARR